MFKGKLENKKALWRSFTYFPGINVRTKYNTTNNSRPNHVTRQKNIYRTKTCVIAKSPISKQLNRFHFQNIYRNQRSQRFFGIRMQVKHYSFCHYSIWFYMGQSEVCFLADKQKNSMFYDYDIFHIQYVVCFLLHIASCNAVSGNSSFTALQFYHLAQTNSQC